MHTSACAKCFAEAAPGALAEMQRSAALALFVGASAFIALIAYEGLAPLLAALAAGGWGLLAVAAFHLLPMCIDAAGMRVMLRAPLRRERVLRARWVGEAVNNLLPVAQLGGPLVMARFLVRGGCAPADAGAAVIVSTTQQMLTQALFALAGIVLLTLHANDPRLLWALLIGSALFGLNALWFYRLQRRGDLFVRLARLLNKVSSGRQWLDFGGSAEALDQAVQSAYARPGAARASFFLNLGGWVVGTGEVWLALQFLGHPVSLADALMIESLGQAIRGIAFVIPAALGVQEGGYVLLCGLVGIAPPVALALSLTKRARDLALGIPGLLYWQYAEGRWLRRRAAVIG